MLVNVTTCTECVHYDECSREILQIDNFWACNVKWPVNWCSRGKPKKESKDD